jgi:predicted O-methyltransferase YrrM
MLLLILAAMLILAVLGEGYRRLSQALSDTQRHQASQRQQDYRQLESFLSLLFTLQPRLPLPHTRGWATSPDFLTKITEVIFVEQPRLVLEASSGVSTLVIAYALQQVGQGKVVTLEHDAHYARMSQSLIAFHGLEERATIVHAPLKSFEHKEQKWLWYNIDGVEIEQPIDLLVIDGPPGDIQPLARYPALPLLYRHLNHQATILLDDGHREDEKQAVALWEQEFRQLSSEFLEMEKGIYVIRKNAPPEDALPRRCSRLPASQGVRRWWTMGES